MTRPTIGSSVTVHRTTRIGHRSWTGTLLSIGIMSCGGTEMGRLAIRDDKGTVLHFAVDPTFDTIVVVSS